MQWALPGGKTTKAAVVLTLLFLAVLTCIHEAGRFLVVSHLQHADAIVVLAGDHDDRYYKGLDLLRRGYAPVLLLDSNADDVKYGHSASSMAEEFIRQTAGELQSQVRVCPITGDSTVQETQHVAACLQEIHAARALLVTSDFHTRRAFSIFCHRLPQYRWSIAAANNKFDFGVDWWRNREWAKTTLTEWTKLGWWELIDRWHFRSP